MSTPSKIYVDPGSTDAIPVYLVVASGTNQYLPRAVLNDSSGNEITAGNPLAIYGNATVTQGSAPWLVNASIVGNLPVYATVATISVGSVSSTVYQGNSPWLVNASVVGQQSVTASIAGSPTIYQGTSPWVVTGTVSITAGVAVAVTNVTLAAIATVYQGNPPWLVNASVVGTPSVNANVTNSSIQVFGTFWQPNQPVTATTATLIIGQMPAVSVAQTIVTIGGGFVAPQADAGATGALTYLNTSLVASCATVKIGNANLYGYHFYNSGSSVAYISLFAQTLATLGKSIPNTQLAVPAGGWADDLSDLPIAYSQGLLIGASASINGTGNPASPVLANIYYR